MGVVYLAISHCTEGDISAADIYSENGILLVAKDTCLNRYIIESLAERGITYIRIYSGSTDTNTRKKDRTWLEVSKTYKDSVLSVKQIINSISLGEKLDYNKAVEVSEIIYQNIENCTYITNCMSEIREFDEYTYNHCVNTAFYSMMLGKWLGLKENGIKKLILSGLLHDIGKAKIPKHILNKKGKLTDEEYELMKKHTLFGYEILFEAVGMDKEVRRSALLHHERTDSSGYPFNASPDAVGLYGKAVAIADVYDAMTSERVYKKRSTPFKAFEMFITMGIGCFDTNILFTFLRNISKYYIGTSVNLSNGEKGNIVYIPPHDILNPIVETASGYIDLSAKDSPEIVH